MRKTGNGTVGRESFAALGCDNSVHSVRYATSDRICSLCVLCASLRLCVGFRALSVMSSSYLLKRLLWALPTLFGVAVVVFVLLRVVPGDPIAMMVPPGARSRGHRSPACRCTASTRRSGTQFVHWLGADAAQAISAIRSACARRSSRSCFGKLPATLELVMVAMLIAIALGVAAAMTGGVFPRPLARARRGRLRRCRARDPRFPVGAAVRPAARRVVPAAADLRAHRSGRCVRAAHRLLSARSAGHRATRSGTRAHCCICCCRRSRWHFRWLRASRACSRARCIETMNQDYVTPGARQGLLARARTRGAWRCATR